MTHETERWRPNALATVTLVTDDLAGSRRFAEQVLGLRLLFEDVESAAFVLGTTTINMLAADAAPEAFDPVSVVPRGGARALFTLEVDDVDRLLIELTERGAAVVTPPTDRPWGVRTANIADPGGHIWELAAPIR